MSNKAAPSFKSFLAFKYWPTWFGIGFLWLVALMPFRFRMLIGSYLGLLTFYLGKERQYITQVNIELCFPELSKSEQQALVKKSFIANGIGLI